MLRVTSIFPHAVLSGPTPGHEAPTFIMTVKGRGWDTADELHLLHVRYCLLRVTLQQCPIAV